ncbi:response regulator [Chitinophaga agrisoli]|uniref:Response regulator n=1 Tax=Chitinophaga agrisoli TaxID=2607653 RepID=A0A5B2VNA0_9BACT|nr:response regulator [Chitinophaga agrisoli]KAA2240571.1 response regulator [Chitinophaga agrisoli]
MSKQAPLNILLADDDAIDRELFIEGINHTGIKYSIKEVSNGEEVFDYLADAHQRPDLIILDFNMPVKDGRITLKELKTQEQFRRIPVVIMSTSNSRFDISLAYDAGANLFVVKPDDFKELVHLLTCLLSVFSRSLFLLKHHN